MADVTRWVLRLRQRWLGLVDVIGLVLAFLRLKKELVDCKKDEVRLSVSAGWLVNMMR